MSDLYPLLMTPVFDPRPWGTTDLAPVYPGHRFEEKIGESWLTAEKSRVANGSLRGKTLGELASEYGRALVGEAAKDARQFPLLTKFLFPHEKLSLQVHPDDEFALNNGEACGKNECWYIAHAKPGAKVALGLKPGTTRRQFEDAIRQLRADELLNWVTVFPGEMIYVAAGTVHTLGPGSIIVETQQQSNTTYRLYDYGRPRELHLARGLAAMKETTGAGKTLRPSPAELSGNRNRLSPLVASPYFMVELLELKDSQEFQTQGPSGKRSVQVLTALEGCGVVEVPGSAPVTLAKGDAVVIPASLERFSVRPQWSVEFLKSSLPGTILPEPAVRM